MKADNDNLDSVHTLDEAAAHLRLTDRGAAKIAKRHGLCMVNGRNILLTGRDIEAIKDVISNTAPPKRVRGVSVKAIMGLPLSPMVETIRDTFVYVMKCNQYVKIGLAQDVDKRRLSLQAGNPYTLKVVHQSEPIRSLTYAGIAERGAHMALAGSRVHGEWFKASPARAIRVVQATCDAARRLAISHDEQRWAA